MISTATLVGALVALFASLVAWLLVWSRDYSYTSWLAAFAEGRLGGYLLTGALISTLVASLALITLATLALLTGRSESQESTAQSEILGPSPTDTPGSGRWDPPVDDHWMELVEECVGVVDELDRHMSDFDAPRREVAHHVILRLEEVLERSGVEVISDEPTFDRSRHKPVSADATTTPGAAISETLSPGFAVERRVLRRARVRVE